MEKKDKDYMKNEKIVNQRLQLRLAHFVHIISFLLVSLYSNLLEATEIPLLDEQYGDYDRGEYLVRDNIIIPAGKTMTIAAGSIIRFHRYSGIKVEGTLICKGDQNASTLFTAVKEQSDTSELILPDLFLQWNGIDVTSTGSIEFEFVRIFNSVFGIKVAKNNNNIILKKVVFWNNEQNFLLGDTLQLVVDDRQYSYPEPEKEKFDIDTSKQLPEPVKETVSRQSAVDTIRLVQITKPEKEVRQRENNWLPMFFGGVTITSGVLGLIYHYKAKDYNRDYLNCTVPNTCKELREKGNRYYFLRDACAVTGFLGGVGFSITLFF